MKSTDTAQITIMFYVVLCNRQQFFFVSLFLVFFFLRITRTRWIGEWIILDFRRRRKCIVRREKRIAIIWHILIFRCNRKQNRRMNSPFERRSTRRVVTIHAITRIKRCVIFDTTKTRTPATRISV